MQDATILCTLTGTDFHPSIAHRRISGEDSTHPYFGAYLRGVPSFFSQAVADGRAEACLLYAYDILVPLLALTKR
jgi:hypothetical protein